MLNFFQLSHKEAPEIFKGWFEEKAILSSGFDNMVKWAKAEPTPQ